jgi:glycosyltransferase involved in cell wall biosynthesis
MLYPLIKVRSIYALHETHLPTKMHLLIYKTLNKKIDFFVSVSKHISYTLQNLQIAPDKIKLIYNGIDFSPISTNMEMDDKIQLAIIGQVAPWKGHEILIHAIKHLKDDTIKNFHLNIYGSNNNDYSKELKTLIEYNNLQSYVSWKGFIEDQDEIYKQMTIIVVPSVVEESFSLTAAEGMMRGKAVIVSNKGGMMELVEHGTNGLVFESGNAFELSACLAELVNDREKINFFGTNAKTKAMQNYSYKTMTRHYIDLYEL